MHWERGCEVGAYFLLSSAHFIQKLENKHPCELLTGRWAIWRMNEQAGEQMCEQVCKLMCEQMCEQICELTETLYINLTALSLVVYCSYLPTYLPSFSLVSVCHSVYLVSLSVGLSAVLPHLFLTGCCSSAVPLFVGKCDARNGYR